MQLRPWVFEWGWEVWGTGREGAPQNASERRQTHARQGGDFHQAAKQGQRMGSGLDGGHWQHEQGGEMSEGGSTSLEAA
eukprot:360793-Chlamydomonas_euryale.AAC.2